MRLLLMLLSFGILGLAQHPCTGAEIWAGVCSTDTDCAFDFNADQGVGIDTVIQYYATKFLQYGPVAPYWTNAWLALNKTTWASLSTCPDALSATQAIVTLSWLTRYRPRLSAQSTGGACSLPTQSAIFSELTQKFSCGCVVESASCNPSAAALVAQDGINFYLPIVSISGLLFLMLLLNIVVIIKAIQIIRAIHEAKMQRMPLMGEKLMLEPPSDTSIELT